MHWSHAGRGQKAIWPLKCSLRNFFRSLTNFIPKIQNPEIPHFERDFWAKLAFLAGIIVAVGISCSLSENCVLLIPQFRNRTTPLLTTTRAFGWINTARIVGTQKTTGLDGHHRASAAVRVTDPIQSHNAGIMTIHALLSCLQCYVLCTWDEGMRGSSQKFPASAY